jgi:hypothetical protein
MNDKEIPMVAGRKGTLPVVYGDTPSFLGVDVVKSDSVNSDYDIVVGGVPWEGTITWGSFTGCELAPRTIRHAAARYGGFLPEYDIDIFDHLKIADIGDVTVNTNDPADTMENVYQTSRLLYGKGVIPVFLGGDHSFTPEIVRALSDSVRAGRGGISTPTWTTPRVSGMTSIPDAVLSIGSRRSAKCGMRASSISESVVRGIPPPRWNMPGVWGPAYSRSGIFAKRGWMP